MYFLLRKTILLLLLTFTTIFDCIFDSFDIKTAKFSQKQRIEAVEYKNSNGELFRQFAYRNIGSLLLLFVFLL